jgi:hypothetical protein
LPSCDSLSFGSSGTCGVDGLTDITKVNAVVGFVAEAGLLRLSLLPFVKRWHL